LSWKGQEMSNIWAVKYGQNSYMNGFHGHIVTCAMVNMVKIDIWMVATVQLLHMSWLIWPEFIYKWLSWSGYYIWAVWLDFSWLGLLVINIWVGVKWSRSYMNGQVHITEMIFILNLTKDSAPCSFIKCAWFRLMLFWQLLHCLDPHLYTADIKQRTQIFAYNK